MFRRASSVPLALTHDSPGTYAPVSSVPAFSPPPLSPASSISYCSDSSFPDSDNASVGVFLLVLFVQKFHLIFISFFAQVSPLYDFVPFSPPGSPCSTNMDNNGVCSLGPVAGTPAAGLCPAGAAPEFFSNSSYSTLCDWAGTGADTFNFNNGSTKLGLPSMAYGFPSPDMIEDHPFSFLLHGPAAVAADPWCNALSTQELLARAQARLSGSRARGPDRGSSRLLLRMHDTKSICTNGAAPRGCLKPISVRVRTYRKEKMR
jgi:hypothetical protein